MITTDDLSIQADYYEKIDQSADSIETSLLDIENDLGRITKSINKVAGVFNTALSIGTFSAISKQLWDIDKSTTQIAVRMGKGKDGAKALKTTITELQVELGASAQVAQELTYELAKKNYVGNIQDAAKASYLFADATGLGVTETAELTDTLSKVVGFSEKATGSMYAGIVKVQQANGLSDKAMSSLANHIGEASTNMKAFGKSDEQIKTMAISTAKLVSSFEKVGISAQTALGWVERLTDPERIEENIGLYSQLGISMTDALSGADISGQLESGMKEFGQKLKAMGPIAGAQYAKAFGVSYKEAIKASDAQAVTEDATTPEEQSLDVLKGLASETHNITRTMEVGFNKVTGIINGLGPVIMTVAAFASGIIKKLLEKSKKEMSSTITKGVTDGFKKIKPQTIQAQAKVNLENGEELSSIVTDGIGKGFDKANGKIKTNLEGVKNYFGSMFDTTALRQSQKELDGIINESGVHLEKNYSYIFGDITKEVGDIGRGIYRWSDPLRLFGSNRDKMAENYWRNEQNKLVEQYQESQAQIQRLDSLRGKLGEKDEQRRLKALSALEEKQKTLLKMMDEASQGAVDPNKIRLRELEQQTSELGKQEQTLNEQIKMYEAMSKSSELSVVARTKAEEKMAELETQRYELQNKLLPLSVELEELQKNANVSEQSSINANKDILSSMREQIKALNDQKKGHEDTVKNLEDELKNNTLTTERRNEILNQIIEHKNAINDCSDSMSNLNSLLDDENLKSIDNLQLNRQKLEDATKQKEAAEENLKVLKEALETDNLGEKARNDINKQIQEQNEKLKNANSLLDEAEKSLKTNKKSNSEVLKALKEQLKEEQKKASKQKESIQNIEKQMKAVKKNSDAYKELEKEYEKANKELKNSVEKSEALKTALEGAANAAKGIKTGGIKEPSLSTKKKISSLPRRVLTKLGTTKDRNGVETAPTTGKQIAKGIGKNVAKGAGKLAIKGVGGLTKGLLKIAGPMLIISTLMKFIQKPLEKLKDTIVDNLQPIMEEMTPIVEEIATTLLNVMMPIFKALMPVVKLLVQLVSFLLPPIARLLSRVIDVIGWFASLFIKVVAGIMKAFGKNTDSLEEAAKSMRGMGQSIRDSLDNNSYALKENTDTEEKVSAENKKGQISVAGDGSLAKTEATVNSTSASEAVGTTKSTSGTTFVRLEKTQRDREIEDNTQNVLKEIKGLLEKLNTALTKEKKPIIRSEGEDPLDAGAYQL